MKKVLLIIVVILLSITSTKNNQDNLIRIRILANSNSSHDQEIKENISNDIKNEMYSLLKDETNINNARKTIKNNIPLLNTIINNNLQEESYSYKINYGYNYFPEKTYNNKTYKSGKYESLLITLGEGKGDNWWCILFPPLCLLEAEESDEVEYDFFLFELIDKLLH